MSKNKSKTYRTIPPEAAMPLGFIRKLPKRSQGPKRYPHAKLRSAMQHYIQRHPGLTSTTKRVGCLLTLWYRPGRTLHPSLATVASELSVALSTAQVAVATLHDLELVFMGSGGFGAMASEYVPNYWLVLNEATGAVVKEAEYDFSAGKWRTSAKSVTENRYQKPVTENRYQDTPQERRISAKSVTENRYPCSDSVMTGANAATASANAATASATAPRENDSENAPVMTGISHTLATWDNLASPNNPEKKWVTRYLDGSLSDTMAAKVGNMLAKRCRKYATPLSMEDFLADITKESGFRIDNDVFHSSVNLRAVLVEGGGRLVIC